MRGRFKVLFKSIDFAIAGEPDPLFSGDVTKPECQESYVTMNQPTMSALDAYILSGRMASNLIGFWSTAEDALGGQFDGQPPR